PGDPMRRFLARFAATALAGVVIFVPGAVEGGAINILRVIWQRVTNTLWQVGIGLVWHDSVPFLHNLSCADNVQIPCQPLTPGSEEAVVVFAANRMNGMICRIHHIALPDHSVENRCRYEECADA